jgi:hypothetical protein
LLFNNFPAILHQRADNRLVVAILSRQA